MRVYVPWKVGGYYNGMHPLLTSLLEGGDGDLEWAYHEESIDVLRKANDLARETTAAALELCARCPEIPLAEALRLLESRNGAISLQAPDAYDVAFHHSVPWTNAARPFVLHLEHILPLFIPVLTLGAWRNELRIRELPIVRFTRHLLEHPNCKAVFTHMQFTIEQLRQVFASTTIDAKTRKVPLGVAASRRAPREADGTLRLLFTNSYYGNPFNFYERGGGYVIEAFLELAKRHPNVELRFHSGLPDNLRPDLRDAVRSHPRIRHVDHHVSEEEIAEAFASSDVFLLPALSIHSVSALRAMAAGLVCVATDVYGYGEYMRDGVDGILIPGVRERVSTTANDAGLLMDDYSMAFESKGFIMQHLLKVLDGIAADPESFRPMRAAAIETIRTRFNLDGWRTAVHGILRRCVE